jgi:hypothetical protein
MLPHICVRYSIAQNGRYFPFFANADSYYSIDLWSTRMQSLEGIDSPYRHAPPPLPPQTNTSQTILSLSLDLCYGTLPAVIVTWPAPDPGVRMGDPARLPSGPRQLPAQGGEGRKPYRPDCGGPVQLGEWFRNTPPPGSERKLTRPDYLSMEMVHGAER